MSLPPRYLTVFGKLQMGKYSEHTYVNKNCPLANIGDYVQSIAIDYLYTHANIANENTIYIGIDETASYDGSRVVLPLIGIFERNTVDSRFPCSKNIDPVFISCLVYDDVFENRPTLVAYLKQYEPIGCRDERTKSIFLKYGIEAYIMGCVSICLPLSSEENEKNTVYLIDVPTAVKKIIPDDLLSESVVRTHEIMLKEYPVTLEECKRVTNYTKNRLKEYSRNARLVITSRLHAAAPCLAMGIPVILCSNNFDHRFAWIDKYIELYSEDRFNKIQWNPMHIDIEHVKEIYYSLWNSIISDNKAHFRDCLLELDSFYSSRIRSDYFSGIKKTLMNLPISKNDSYIIWGAGQHCDYAVMLMGEIHPSCHLVCIVDKYKTGFLYNTKVIHPSEIKQIDFKVALITTRGGVKEAIETLELYGKKKNIDYFFLFSKDVDL